MANNTWNYRVLAHEEEGRLYFIVHEVYYRDSTPVGYTENGITVEEESLDEMYKSLSRMKECADKPVLWAGDKFPQEYK